MSKYRIKGCSKEDYDDFFRATGYIENTQEAGAVTSVLPACDSDKCCKSNMDSTIAVRKAALEDLRLKSYTFKLTVTYTVETESGVNVTLTEENTQQFRGLSVLSEQYKVIHDFSLRHKRVEPTRPKNFIFRILGRFSPCNTGSIDASKKHQTMQKLKFFGCSQF